MMRRSSMVAAFVLGLGVTQYIHCSAQQHDIQPVSISCVCLYKPTDRVEGVIDMLTLVATLQKLQYKRYNSDREIALTGLLGSYGAYYGIKGYKGWLEWLLSMFNLYVIILKDWRTFVIVNKEFIQSFQPLIIFPEVHQHWAIASDESSYEQLGQIIQAAKKQLHRDASITD